MELAAALPTVEAHSPTNTERRYHDTVSPYALPNDAIEQDRLDAQAAAITEMIGGCPFLAPIQSMAGIAKAVDVGCGTGIAAVQIAGLFPAATVYGLDLSPVPEAVQNLAPSNVVWTKGNVLDVDENNSNTPEYNPTPTDLIFAPASLDYVFGRMLILGVTDWARYFRTVARALKPGGIVEHQDIDWAFYHHDTSERVDPAREWHRKFGSAMHKAGLSTEAGSGAAGLMEAAGLEIVSVQTFAYSFVPSPTVAIGRYVQEKLVPQFPELMRKLLEPEGITGAELQRLVQQMRRDKSPEAGLYQKYTVTVARRPLAG